MGAIAGPSVIMLATSPTSKSSIFQEFISDSLAARADPADPAPTTIKSYSFSIWSLDLFLYSENKNHE